MAIAYGGGSWRDMEAIFAVMILDFVANFVKSWFLTFVNYATMPS